MTAEDASAQPVASVLSAADIAAAGAGAPPSAEEAVHAYRQRANAKSASVWLFIIAVVTVFNAGHWANGDTTRVEIGPIATRLLTRLVAPVGATGIVIELAVSIGVAVLFAVLGWLAYKGHARALLVGTVLYAADFVLYLAVLGSQDSVGLALHGFVLLILASRYVRIWRLQHPAAVSTREIVVSAPPSADDHDRWQY